eukprot:maker-scaffold1108_size62262-snap-gene-0.11 protein:Tk09363 transcript:maker-scaffold1108_size62262-snap-gene-0.11-mRNA-1 annotation:"mediator of rna polymerase ii transcription subunit 15-like"
MDEFSLFWERYRPRDEARVSIEDAKAAILDDFSNILSDSLGQANGGVTANELCNWIEKMKSDMRSFIGQLLKLLFQWVLDFLVFGPIGCPSSSKPLRARHYRILWRSGWFDQDYHDLNNFMLWPLGSKDPNQIWLDNSWTLQGVNTESVWFSRSPSDVYRLARFPFVWFGQNSTSTQILTLSHVHFWAWIDELGLLETYQPKSNLIFIWTTARSGSTLLCQILSRIPQTLVISEPYAWVYLLGLRNAQKMSPEDEERYIRALLLLTLKMAEDRDRNVETIVIKFPRMCTPQIGMVRQTLPQGNHIFLSRRPDKSIESWLKIATNLRGSLFYKYGLRPAVLHHLSLPYTPMKYRSLLDQFLSQKWTMPLPAMFALSYGGSILCFRQHCEAANVNLTYDDLTAPNAFTRANLLMGILKTCRITTPVDLPLLMDAFRNHSQMGLMNSQEIGSDSQLTHGQQAELLFPIVASLAGAQQFLDPTPITDPGLIQELLEEAIVGSNDQDISLPPIVAVDATIPDTPPTPPQPDISPLRQRFRLRNQNRPTFLPRTRPRVITPSFRRTPGNREPNESNEVESERPQLSDTISRLRSQFRPRPRPSVFSGRQASNRPTFNRPTSNSLEEEEAADTVEDNLEAVSVEEESPEADTVEEDSPEADTVEESPEADTVEEKTEATIRTEDASIDQSIVDEQAESVESPPTTQRSLFAPRRRFRPRPSILRSQATTTTTTTETVPAYPTDEDTSAENEDQDAPTGLTDASSTRSTPPRRPPPFLRRSRPTSNILRTRFRATTTTTTTTVATTTTLPISDTNPPPTTTFPLFEDIATATEMMMMADTTRNILIIETETETEVPEALTETLTEASAPVRSIASAFGRRRIPEATRRRVPAPSEPRAPQSQAQSEPITSRGQVPRRRIESRRRNPSVTRRRRPSPQAPTPTQEAVEVPESTTNERVLPPTARQIIRIRPQPTPTVPAEIELETAPPTARQTITETTIPPFTAPRTSPEPFTAPRTSPDTFTAPRTSPDTFTAPRTSPDTFTAPRTSPDTFTAPRTSPGTFTRPRTSPDTFTAPRTSPDTFTAPRTSPDTFTAPRTSPDTFTAPRTSPDTFTAPRTSPDTFTAPRTSPGTFTRPRTSPDTFTAPRTSPDTFTAPRTSPDTITRTSPDSLFETTSETEATTLIETAPRRTLFNPTRTFSRTAPRTLQQTAPRTLTETAPRTLSETAPRTLPETAPRTLPDTDSDTLPKTAPEPSAENESPRTLPEASQRILAETAPRTIPEPDNTIFSASGPRRRGDFTSRRKTFVDTPSVRRVNEFIPRQISPKETTTTTTSTPTSQVPEEFVPLFTLTAEPTESFNSNARPTVGSEPTASRGSSRFQPLSFPNSIVFTDNKLPDEITIPNVTPGIQQRQRVNPNAFSHQDILKQTVVVPLVRIETTVTPTDPAPVVETTFREQPRALPPVAPTNGFLENTVQNSIPRKFKVTKPTQSSVSGSQVRITDRYRVENGDGSLTWGYKSADGSFKEETIGSDCITRGRYGYIDPQGKIREFTYENGIPCDPNTREVFNPRASKSSSRKAKKRGYFDYNTNKFVLPDGRRVTLE